MKTLYRSIVTRSMVAGLISISAVTARSADSNAVTLASPNGELVLQIATIPDGGGSAVGRLVYTVDLQRKPIIIRSSLELDLDHQSALGPHVSIVRHADSENDSTYRLQVGKTSSVRDHYRATRVEIEEPGASGRKFAIEARAYDDGIAFRYVVPEQENISEFRLAQEKTDFRFSCDATAYALLLPNYRSMYESEFHKMPISALGNQGGVDSHALLGLPLLLDLPGRAWVAITEADLRDYSSLYLGNLGSGWGSQGFTSHLAPRFDQTNLCVIGSLPHHSAWRVILVGDEPGRLVEANVVTSLNSPSAIADTSWIHPGKAAWDWWSGSVDANGKPAFTTTNMNRYVDFAAQSGFEYMLIDAGWSSGRDIMRLNGRVDVPEVVRYAATKGIKVWVWISYDEAMDQMERAFPQFERWGVAGVKIDFVQRDDQAGIEFYYRTAEKAAQHHLMVDFHGCTKPTGLERTYPNVLGYEAVLGMEQSKGGARDNPENRVVLPFTRMIAGPMDYTPGGFNNVTRDEFVARGTMPMVMGTRCQQLAMYVVYFAPFQMVSDRPEAYEGQREFEFIREVPAAWDETRVLGGTPDSFVVIARRSARQWFIGAMNNWTARDIDIPLGFLGRDKYSAEIYRDAADADILPKKVAREKTTLTGQSKLRVHLAPGGGFAARLAPK